MSGVNYEGNEIRKGAADSVRTYVEAAGGVFSQECDEAVERIAKAGGTPLVVTKNCRVLGRVYLKDIIKSGVKEKFADLRKMGIKTIMQARKVLMVANGKGKADIVKKAFFGPVTPGGPRQHPCRCTPDFILVGDEELSEI